MVLKSWTAYMHILTRHIIVKTFYPTQTLYTWVWYTRYALVPHALIFLIIAINSYLYVVFSTNNTQKRTTWKKTNKYKRFVRGYIFREPIIQLLWKLAMFFRIFLPTQKISFFRPDAKTVTIQIHESKTTEEYAHMTRLNTVSTKSTQGHNLVTAEFMLL